MAGAFDRELTPTDTLWQQAHMTYISNLRFAAEQCSKVRATLYVLYGLHFKEQLWLECE